MPIPADYFRSLASSRDYVKSSVGLNALISDSSSDTVKFEDVIPCPSPRPDSASSTVAARYAALTTTRTHLSHGRKRPDGYIRRPRNPFMFFRTDWCQKNEGITLLKNHADKSREAARCWNGMSPDERKPFKDLADYENALYKVLYPEYVYRPGRSVKGTKRQPKRPTQRKPVPRAPAVKKAEKKSADLQRNVRNARAPSPDVILAFTGKSEFPAPPSLSMLSEVSDLKLGVADSDSVTLPYLYSMLTFTEGVADAVCEPEFRNSYSYVDGTTISFISEPADHPDTYSIDNITLLNTTDVSPLPSPPNESLLSPHSSPSPPYFSHSSLASCTLSVAQNPLKFPHTTMWTAPSSPESTPIHTVEQPTYLPTESALKPLFMMEEDYSLEDTTQLILGLEEQLLISENLIYRS